MKPGSSRGENPRPARQPAPMTCWLLGFASGVAMATCIMLVVLVLR